MDLSIRIDIEQFSIEVGIDEPRLADALSGRNPLCIGPFSMAAGCNSPAAKFLTSGLDRRQHQFLGRSTEPLHISVLVDDRLTYECDLEFVGLVERLHD